MGIGKTITTTDLLQVMLIYLKLSDQIQWHWLTVLLPWSIIGVGGTVIYFTGLVIQELKKAGFYNGEKK